MEKTKDTTGEQVFYFTEYKGEARHPLNKGTLFMSVFVPLVAGSIAIILHPFSGESGLGVTLFKGLAAVGLIYSLWNYHLMVVEVRIDELALHICRTRASTAIPWEHIADFKVTRFRSAFMTYIHLRPADASVRLPFKLFVVFSTPGVVAADELDRLIDAMSPHVGQV